MSKTGYSPLEITHGVSLLFLMLAPRDEVIRSIEPETILVSFPVHHGFYIAVRALNCKINLFSMQLEKCTCGLMLTRYLFLKQVFIDCFIAQQLRLSLVMILISNIVPKPFFSNPELCCVIASNKSEGYRDLVLMDMNKYIKNQPTKKKKHFTTNLEAPWSDRTCYVATCYC